MAKVYLDTNKVFDLTIRNPKETSENLTGHQICISPLSFHILYYAEHIKVPNHNLSKTISELQIVDLNKKILENSLEGPTSDLEDNLQLHSAVESNCDYFLTNDKKLLNIKFFGKTKIIQSLL